MGIILSAATSIVIMATNNAGVKVTYNMAVESDAGHDGPIKWQTVYLLNDGRIASFGTGNHNSNQSNAMRILDPVKSPGQLLYTEDFPWTQDVSPKTIGSPDVVGEHNLYVTNYDNHPSIYIPTENKIVWPPHGVFDFASKSWTFGDRPPNTQGYFGFLTDPFKMGNVYNPAVAWCKSLDKGIWFGGSNGGNDQDSTYLRVIERNTGGNTPWKLTSTTLSNMQPLHYARNTAVCIGSDLYIAGPKSAGELEDSPIYFYKIDMNTKTVIKALTPYPKLSSSTYISYPQLVHDIIRNRLILIGEGLLIYDLATDKWTNVTPIGWPGYTHVMGVYHPTVDAVFFRGTVTGKPDNPHTPHFSWHRISF